MLLYKKPLLGAKEKKEPRMDCSYFESGIQHQKLKIFMFKFDLPIRSSCLKKKINLKFL